MTSSSTEPGKIKVQVGNYTFRSDFDSGNLAAVEQVHDEENEFICYTARDCEGTPFQTEYGTWFYFAVEGGKKSDIIIISIMNMNPQSKLYSNDYRPMVRVLPSKPCWERTRFGVSYKNREKKFQLKFRHTFEGENDVVYFAFCYPYSYEDHLQKIDFLDKKFRRTFYNGHIYFRRELLVKSPEGRRVDLLTISSTDGIDLSRTEDGIVNLLPEGNERPHVFPNKKVCFLSARIHPGETPGSFVCNGFVDFLLNEDDVRAKALLNLYVFKIVPILNPDGVYHGFYRADPRGVNLNRFYDVPSIHLHPSIYAVKELLRYHSSLGTLFFYLDLHGHASKRGCFIYGNYLEEEEQIENLLYPRLVSLNDPNFDFSGCNFSEKNMRSKDKRDGMSKEGTGRVCVYREFGLLHTYTLECNYNTGRSLNSVLPISRGDKKGSSSSRGEGSAASSSSRNSPVSPVVTYYSIPKYTVSIWNKVGRACAVALLDMADMNPYSRLVRTEYRNAEGVRADLRKKSKLKKAGNKITEEKDSSEMPPKPRPERARKKIVRSNSRRSRPAVLRTTVAMKRSESDKGKSAPSHKCSASRGSEVSTEETQEKFKMMSASRGAEDALAGEE